MVVVTQFFTKKPYITTYGFIDLFINMSESYLTDYFANQYYSGSFCMAFLYCVAFTYRNMFPDIIYFLNQNFATHTQVQSNDEVPEVGREVGEHVA